MIDMYLLINHDIRMLFFILQLKLNVQIKLKRPATVFQEKISKIRRIAENLFISVKR